MRGWFGAGVLLAAPLFFTHSGANQRQQTVYRLFYRCAEEQALCSVVHLAIGNNVDHELPFRRIFANGDCAAGLNLLGVVLENGK